MTLMRVLKTKNTRTHSLTYGLAIGLGFEIGIIPEDPGHVGTCNLAMLAVSQSDAGDKVLLAGSPPGTMLSVTQGHP